MVLTKPRLFVIAAFLAGCMVAGPLIQAVIAQVYDAGNRLNVTGAGGTFPVTVSSIAAGNNNIGDVDVATLPVAFNAGTASATTTRVVIATDDPVNDFAVKGDANLVAHGATDAGNPLKIGCRAVSSQSALTLVTTGQRSDCIMDLDGGIITRPYSLANRLNQTADIADGTSTAILAAAGASTYNCATTIVVGNLTATNWRVDIRDGTAGSVLLPIPASANMGGAAITLPSPLCGSANTAMAGDVVGAGGATVTVAIVGFKTKVPPL